MKMTKKIKMKTIKTIKMNGFKSYPLSLKIMMILLLDSIKLYKT